jgi:PAS domain S-box-containing protein
MTVRILLVEDDKKSAARLARVFTEAGCRVVVASDGAEALDIARRERPDLAISDVLMPEIDGFSLCAIWKGDEDLRPIPFLIYTATYTDPQDQELAMALGADRFIVRPLPPDELVGVIHDVLGQPRADAPEPPADFSENGEQSLKVYNERLVKKLAEKTRRLEEANLALEDSATRATEQTNQLRLLHGVSTFLTSTLVLGDILDHLARELTSILRVNRFSIWLESESGMRCETSFGFDPDGPDPDGAQLSREDPLLRWIDEHRRPVTSHDPDGPISPSGADNVSVVSFFHPRSALVVPLEHRRRVTGLLVVEDSVAPRLFDEDEAELVASVARQAAMVIANARLFAEVGRSERLYRTVLESSGDAIVTLDPSLKITAWSAGAERIFGYTRDEILDKPYALLIPEEEEAERDELFAELRRTGSVRGWEARRRTKDGQIVDVELTIDELGPSTGLTTIMRDITKRRRAESDHEKIQTRLHQSQKLEAIGALASGIAHDFNNILTVILGQSERARTFLDHPQELDRHLRRIHEEARRGCDLTEEVSTLCRRQPLEASIIDLHQAIGEMHLLLRRLIPGNIEIDLDLDGTSLPLRANQQALGRLVLNLVLNARDAMPDGGRATIRTKRIDVDAETAARHPDASPGPHVLLEVEDTGHGMDEDTLQRMFDPFFTTRERNEGGGMGLAVVFGIIAQHRGWTSVHSAPGQGTRFGIYIPVEEGIEPDSRPAARLDETDISSLRGSGQRILIVEDEPTVRDFASEFLGGNGYEVRVAESVEKALEIYEEEEGRFDLLFSDVVLPDGTGLLVAEHVRDRDPDIGILLSSGYADEKSQWPVIREKGYRFLPKPYYLADLLRAVLAAIAEAGPS